MTKNKPSAVFCPELLSAAGKIDFPMTNDYMFRSVLQSNNYALTGFISALLRIPPEQISSAEIINPIILGEACSDKEFRLDINVVLNDRTIINLEMQVSPYSDWVERSLVYLCRNFDMLSHGEDYSETKVVIHISILDFTLFKEAPEFYSCNRFMNTRTHQIYSGKLALNVLDLTQIELATDKDKAWKLDYWARLFKAATWEEIRMIAQNNAYLTETSNSIFRMNADDIARKRCLDREEYYRDINRWRQQIAQQEKAIAQQEKAIAEKNAALQEKDRIIAELQAKLDKN